MNRLFPAAVAAFLAALPLAADAGMSHGQGDMGMVGEVSASATGIDPTAYLTSFNFSHLPAADRARYYRETALAGGGMLREYWITAIDREIEIAPGVRFPAWTYNGQVPGPTIRATEGDTVRIHFANAGSKPHTMHFHGYHPAGMDGSMPGRILSSRGAPSSTSSPRSPSACTSTTATPPRSRSTSTRGSTASSSSTRKPAGRRRGSW